MPHNRLREFRKQLGIKQKQFHEELGFSQTYISECERGTKRISHDLLKILFDKYGLSSNWLLYGYGDQFVQNTNQKPISLQEQLFFIGTKLEFNRGNKALYNNILNSLYEVLEQGTYNDFANETLSKEIKANEKAVQFYDKEMEVFQAVFNSLKELNTIKQSNS